MHKYQNLLKDSVISKINQAYVGDVTQFSIRGRNAFLALLTDLYNREIVGYAISHDNNTQLVTACLRRALAKRGSLAGGIHHTDADVRYCSHAYVAEMKNMGLRISMVCDNVYENAHAESLNKTLKYKVINLNEFDSLAEAEARIASYIDFYNNIKPHSSLGWRTPVAFAALEGGKKNMQKMIPILRG